jgi:hypothetical protein
MKIERITCLVLAIYLIGTGIWRSSGDGVYGDLLGWKIHAIYALITGLFLLAVSMFAWKRT